MHELSLCESVYGIVDRAREGHRVVGVELAVGQLRQVVPDTLVYCWQLVTEGTPLAGSHLQIDHIPVSLRCFACEADTVVGAELSLACGACGSADAVVVGGEELLVTAIEVDDDAAADSGAPAARQEA